MSELYRHLLIPPDALFLPELESVARFLAELGALGALPKETKFIVVVETGRTRVWGTNAKTGEKYYGPDLKIRGFLELQDAIDSASGEGNFDLVAEARGPAEIVPFDLYDADNYASRHPGVLSQKPVVVPFHFHSP